MTTNALSTRTALSTPVQREDAALVLFLLVGALISAPLLFPAAALAGMVALGLALPGGGALQSGTRAALFAVISLLAGVGVAATLGCEAGYLTTLGLFALSCTRL